MPSQFACHSEANSLATSSYMHVISSVLLYAIKIYWILHACKLHACNNLHVSFIISAPGVTNAILDCLPFREISINEIFFKNYE